MRPLAGTAAHPYPCVSDVWTGRKGWSPHIPLLLTPMALALPSPASFGGNDPDGCSRTNALLHITPKFLPDQVGGGQCFMRRKSLLTPQLLLAGQGARKIKEPPQQKRKMGLGSDTLSFNPAGWRLPRCSPPTMLPCQEGFPWVPPSCPSSCTATGGSGSRRANPAASRPLANVPLRAARRYPDELGSRFRGYEVTSSWPY